ncbi:hypothetical protein [uncultured Psychroserpens sp.]|uniref:hypothetical protein n=1 Tax=uncultured Psychroserpens sp. TaxID=255436 RepID=UPI00263156B0|nr:hypothetical protein [uncultured Psychroserpens sp.]
MKNLYLILLVSLFFSCKEEKKAKKTVDFKNFSIEVPQKWVELQLNGIDSYSKGFLTKEEDSIMIDYGKYSSKIDDVVNVSNYSEKPKLDSLGFPTDEMFFSNTPDIDKNQGTFHNEYYLYKKVDDKVCKVQIPKIVGKGLTKVYFGSIDDSNNSLTVYGRDLDSTNQDALLEAFNSIKFKE